jgi:hypothetical protein
MQIYIDALINSGIGAEIILLPDKGAFWLSGKSNRQIQDLLIMTNQYYQ